MGCLRVDICIWHGSVDRRSLLPIVEDTHIPHSSTSTTSFYLPNSKLARIRARNDSSGNHCEIDSGHRDFARSNPHSNSKYKATTTSSPTPLSIHEQTSNSKSTNKTNLPNQNGPNHQDPALESRLAPSQLPRRPGQHDPRRPLQRGGHQPACLWQPCQQFQGPHCSHQELLVFCPSG